MSRPLRDWMSEHHPDWTNLSQAVFVLEQIVPLVNAGIDYEDQAGAMVISEHKSKGVRLPVYSVTRPGGALRVVLRNNFYNWKMSVISAVPVLAPEFPALFHTTPPVEPDYTGDELHPVYFEGFPDELIFGYHCANPFRFSAEVSGNYALWAVVFATVRAAGFIGPMTWRTQESHRKELDAARDRRLAREAARTYPGISAIARSAATSPSK